MSLNRRLWIIYLQRSWSYIWRWIINVTAGKRRKKFSMFRRSNEVCMVSLCNPISAFFPLKVYGTFLEVVDFVCVFGKLKLDSCWRLIIPLFWEPTWILHHDTLIFFPVHYHFPTSVSKTLKRHWNLACKVPHRAGVPNPWAGRRNGQVCMCDK